MPRINPVDRKEYIKKVALFQSMTHGYYSVVHAPSYCVDKPEELERYNLSGEYVRLSEWMDIDLVPLSNNKLTEAALAALAIERAKLVDEFKKQLAKIDERAANFKALTFDGDAS